MSKTTLQNLIIAVSSFVVIVGATALMFYSINNDSVLLEEQILAVAGQNQQEEALLRLERIAQNSEAERTELESYFLVRESDSISFLSEVERIARNLGVSLETTGIRQVATENREWIEFSMNAGGSRSDTERFIASLEKAPFVSRITSVSMQGNVSGNWQADIIVQVQFLNYVQ